MGVIVLSHMNAIILSSTDTSFYQIRNDRLIDEVIKLDNSSHHFIKGAFQNALLYKLDK